MDDSRCSRAHPRARAAVCFPPLDGLAGGGSDGSVEAAGDGDARDATGDGGPALAFCASQVDASFATTSTTPTVRRFRSGPPSTPRPGDRLARVDAGFSVPNALAITYPASAASSQIAEELDVPLAGTTSRVHVVYAMIVDSPDTTSGSYVEGMELSFKTQDGSLLSVREELTDTSGLRFVAGVYPNGGNSSFPGIGDGSFAPNVWHHVDLVIDVGATPAVGSLAIDGDFIVSNAAIAGATFGPGRSRSAPVRTTRSRRPRAGRSAWTMMRSGPSD